MTKKERYKGVVGWFEQNMPVAETELHYDSPFHLLIAVILSAQCTDKRVNMTTPELFNRFPDPKTLAEASFDEVFPLVSSISYPRNKSNHLIGMAQMLVNDFGGEVPSDIDQLMKLPGVGRKTANVIASIVYDKPVIAVDTHVSEYRTDSDCRTERRLTRWEKNWKRTLTKTSGQSPIIG